MSAPYIIPFNHQPVLTGTRQNASYTVPSGKYSRVVATLSCSIATTYPVRDGNSNSNSNATSLEFWARAGQVVSTGGATGSGSGAAGASIAALSYATLLIDGGIISRVDAYASGNADPAGSAVSATGTYNVSYYFEEYNEIS